MNWPVLLIKATLLFLAAFGATALLRRSAASTRHLIWSGLFAFVVALPLLNATLPRLDIPVPAAWQIAVPRIGHTDGSVAARAVLIDGTAARDRQLPSDAPGRAVDSSRGGGNVPIRPGVSRLLLAIWLPGAIAALASLIPSHSCGSAASPALRQWSPIPPGNQPQPPLPCGCGCGYRFASWRAPMSRCRWPGGAGGPPSFFRRPHAPGPRSDATSS